MAARIAVVVPVLAALASAAVATAVWPVAGGLVLHGFDPPPLPWQSGHRGVDLAGSAGEDVVAALAGTVVFAGRIGATGIVVVDHGDGRRTTYQPVSARVRVGDHVATGQVIGTLEVAGGHCQPDACLHWGLIDDSSGLDVYQDPTALVPGRPGPVRLLPVDE